MASGNGTWRPIHAGGADRRRCHGEVWRADDGAVHTLAAADGIAAAAPTGGYLAHDTWSAGKPQPTRLPWRKTLPDSLSQVWTAARGRLLVTGKEGAGLAVLDPDTGRTVWQSAPYGSARSASDGHTVFTIPLDGALHARDLTTGTRR